MGFPLLTGSRRVVIAVALVSVTALAALTGTTASGAATRPDAALDAALAKFVKQRAARPASPWSSSAPQPLTCTPQASPT